MIAFTGLLLEAYQVLAILMSAEPSVERPQSLGSRNLQG